jgi:hypothetical protein
MSRLFLWIALCVFMPVDSFAGPAADLFTALSGRTGPHQYVEAREIDQLLRMTVEEGDLSTFITYLQSKPSWRLMQRLAAVKLNDFAFGVTSSDSEFYRERPGDALSWNSTENPSSKDAWGGSRYTAKGYSDVGMKVANQPQRLHPDQVSFNRGIPLKDPALYDALSALATDPALHKAFGPDFTHAITNLLGRVDVTSSPSMFERYLTTIESVPEDVRLALSSPLGDLFVAPDTWLRDSKQFENAQKHAWKLEGHPQESRVKKIFLKNALTSIESAQQASVWTLRHVGYLDETVISTLMQAARNGNTSAFYELGFAFHRRANLIAAQELPLAQLITKSMEATTSTGARSGVAEAAQSLLSTLNGLDFTFKSPEAIALFQLRHNTYSTRLFIGPRSVYLWEVFEVEHALVAAGVEITPNAGALEHAVAAVNHGLEHGFSNLSFWTSVFHTYFSVNEVVAAAVRAAYPEVEKLLCRADFQLQKPDLQ